MLVLADMFGYDVSKCDTATDAVPLHECQVSCAAGFAAEQLEVFCDEGTTDFRLTGCYQYCEAPQGIDNAMWPSCASGSTVQHSNVCVAQCVPGYTARPSELRCERGILVPQSFECNQANCNAPQFVANAKDPSCQEGVLLISGTTCTPQCREGYEASLPELLCDKGILSPSNFSCDGRPCSALVHEDYATPSCAEGSEIPHGGVCTGQCLPGSTALPKVLQCQVQELDPPNFTCGQLCDAPVDIQHALEPSCLEGAVLEHGTFCSPQCSDGFVPLVALDAELQAVAPPGAASLWCLDGSMHPARFTCAAVGCTAPLVEGAADPACAEGFNIGSGDVCTASCQPGYEASPAKLQCMATALTPSTFSCRPQSCMAPDNIWNAATPACAEGQVISHGESCTPSCLLGFAPTEVALSCRFGSFLPSSFGCSQAAVFGMQVWSVAAATTGGVALAAFRQSAALSIHVLQDRDGMVVSTGSQRLDESGLPNPPLMLPFGNGQALLLFFRHSSCTQDLVLQGVSSSGSTVQAAGADVSTAASIRLNQGPLAGAWLGSIAFILAGSFSSRVSWQRPGTVPRPGPSMRVTPIDPSAVAVAAIDEKVLVAYIIDGCLRLRLVATTNPLTFEEEEDAPGDTRELQGESCTTTSVVLSTLSDSFLLASADQRNVQLCGAQVSLAHPPGGRFVSSYPMTFFSRFFGEDAAHVIFDQEQNQFYYDTSVGRWRQRGMEHFEEDEDWKPRPRETVQAATEKTPVEELMTPPRVYGTHLLDLRDRAEKLKSPNGGTARKAFAAELTSDMHVASDSERATEPPNSPSLTEASEEPDLEVPTLTRSVAMVREDDEQFSMLLPTLQESSTANAKVYAQALMLVESIVGRVGH
eukprot:symbB.v1.2.006239.t2/scaffold370.1/size393101/5